VVLVFLFGATFAADDLVSPVSASASLSLALPGTSACPVCTLFCVAGKVCRCGTCVSIDPTACTSCGASCSRPGLSWGVCNKSLKCVARGLKAPVCDSTCPVCTILCVAGKVCRCGKCVSIDPTECPCGTSCTMSSGGSGVCQTDGHTCAVNVVAPNCVTHCPKYPCALPVCDPPGVLETTKDANGCPGCPHCVIPGCTDTSCTDGFCYNKQCVPYSGVGGPCGGFIIPPKRCRPGLQCHMGKIPDAGGTCVAKPTCRVCPLLACPIAQQVTASASVDTTAASAAIFCPPCPRCCFGGNCLHTP